VGFYCRSFGEVGLAEKSVFTPRYDRLRALLIDARKSAGLTQVELAERLRRPQSFVSKYERGERRLDVVEFLEVTDALEVQPAKLIERIGRA
jgi:transcriptional regulator with XRE-family HTH domain